MNLPKLFKLTSTGALQEWQIGVEDGNVIVTRWGQVDGAIQEGRDPVKEGKNIGKANETDPNTQARLEAKAQWEKKLKKGYVQNLKDAEKGKVDEVIEGGVFPMLAQKFSEQGHKILYPAYAQPKFDGHRCIAIVKNGKASLWSRTRKPITGLPHIVKALEAKFKNVTLDGELYNHSYKDKFEELTSFIRNPEPKEGHEVVQFHIYDWVNEEPFVKRLLHLDASFSTSTAKCLQQVKTIEVMSEDDLSDAFDTFRAAGYEGAMVRNAVGLYVNKRSYDLQKIKEFDDDEFKVIRVVEGRGKLLGHAIFVCVTKSGAEFNVKMKGKTEELRKYFEKPSLSVGKMLTVAYQGITNKTEVPRFPVGLRFRKDL